MFQLPTYAPDLNPQEGIWALVKRDIGNLAAADLGQITRVVKRRLKIRFAYRWGVWRRLKTPCSPICLLGGMQGLRRREGTAWRCSGVRAAVRS